MKNKFLYEDKARQKGFSLVIGIDEAGRGPLAGPVVASAVVLKTPKFKNKIDDSKKLTPLQREKAFHEIQEKGYVGVGIVSELVIDSINILESTYHAMSVAVTHLMDRLPVSEVCQNEKVVLLVDGKFFKTTLPYRYEAIISGDALCQSIACASIVAKVTRDRILNAYDKIFPQYGFCRHKGYGTLGHFRAIREFGLSPIHRRTYLSNYESE